MLVKDVASLLNSVLGLVPMSVVNFNPEAFFKPIYFCGLPCGCSAEDFYVPL
jgi:hypothetical protein